MLLYNLSPGSSVEREVFVSSFMSCYFDSQGCQVWPFRSQKKICGFKKNRLASKFENW